MLDKSKVVKQLQSLSQRHFVHFVDDFKIMKQTWEKIDNDTSLSEQFNKQSFKLVIPSRSGEIGFTKKVDQQVARYSVCAVDGSQIYYDKHQGMPCYVLNIGTVGLRYGYSGKAVYLNSF